jgi:hypothetical protein
MESVWIPTKIFAVANGNGNVVVRDGQLGYAKFDFSGKREKLASELGRAVGAPIPRAEFGTVAEVQGAVISFIHNDSSRDLASKNEKEKADPKLISALRAASGLVAFNAWVDQSDPKDDNLVIEIDNDGSLRVVGIDFEGAFNWVGRERVINVSVPPTLLENMDEAVVAEQVGAIERLCPTTIAQFCKEAGINEGIAEALVARQLILRQSLQKRVSV